MKASEVREMSIADLRERIEVEKNNQIGRASCRERVFYSV